MFYGSGKTVDSPKLDLTLPSNNLNEVSLPEMEADPNRSDIDSGHLYGFMILFIDKLSNANQFERVNSYYGYDLGFDDIGFFGDPNRSYVPTEYFFCVPPRSISFGEPTTTVIQPLLGRNYTKEHQGILFRPLTISGTTGFRPGMYATNSMRGVDGRGIPINERTGYFNFIQLRNMFRYYQTLVSNPKYISSISAGKNLDVVMVWVNFHDGEYWECEPVGFSTGQDASRPLMFSYEISCTCLRKYDSLVFKSGDFLGEWVDKALSYAYEALSDIQKWSNLASNYSIKYATVGRSLMNNAFSLANKVIDVGLRVAGTPLGIASIPGDLILQARFAWDTLSSKLESSYSSLRGAYGSADSLSGAYGSLGGAYGSNEYGQLAMDALYGSYLLASASIIISKTLNNLYAAKRTCETTSSYRVNPTYTAGTVDYPDFDFDRTRSDTIPASRYVVDRVHDGETIYTVAKRVLGNENRFEELIAINNLVPPYISTYAIEKGVLVPGSEILVPVNNADSRIDGNLVLNTRSSDLGSFVSETNLPKILYGTDVRVTFSGYGGTGYPKVDMMVENGDLVYVEGSNNFVQAMAIKVNTERGSLKLHPWFGRAFLVGMKTSPAIVATTAMSFKKCILTDPRVAEVDNVKINLNGDTLNIKLKVTAQRYLTSTPIVVRERI